jgi:hypothetical protein
VPAFTKGKPVERGLMARKLNVYQTSFGFFDQAIAAPSMKAVLEAWGSNSNLFHQGVATKPIRARRLLGSNRNSSNTATSPPKDCCGVASFKGVSRKE